jgi:hypothetical protein
LQSASAPQAARQDPLPEQYVRPHSPAVSVRAGVAVQVPGLPGRLHASQVPPQAPLQQTPSTQLPEAQVRPAVQAVPSGVLAVQAPPAQWLPVLQSASVLQGLAQEAPPPQRARPHSLEGSLRAGTRLQVPALPGRLHARQVPVHAPSQHTPSTQLPEAHSAAPAQDSPSPRLSAQVPALQKAFGLQSGWSAQPERQLLPPPHQVTPHSPAGSRPAGTALHVPSLPVTLQASHVPAQPVSQQTPSTQEADAHWPAVVQAWPSPLRAAHAPASQ